MRISSIILGLLFVFSIFSCRQPDKEPFFKADISDVEKKEVVIGRLDSLLFEIDTLNLYEELKPHIGSYPIIGNELHTLEGQKSLLEYITDPLNRLLYSESRLVWDNLMQLETDLAEAFRYYRFHFNEAPLPRVYSYISMLNYHNPITFIDENSLAIGLDNYLGQGFELYGQVGIPLYLTFRMQPPFALIDLIKVLGEKQLRNYSNLPETFLDFMIFDGKLLYFLDCMLPLTHDTLKIEYSNEQLDWMKKNTGFVWSYFLENEMLFSSDRQTIIKFIGDAPFTAPFGRTSPPRTAAFIGWQIVREFMRRNPQTTLPELFAKTNSQEILSKSKFRPR